MRLHLKLEVEPNSRLSALPGRATRCRLAAHAARHEDAHQARRGSPRAFPGPADGGAPARERDPHAARPAQARPQGGRVSIHDLLLEPPEYVETAKVFDMLLAVPKYGRVKVNKVLVAVPHLAEQDDRRPLAAPAHRAGQHAAPLASPRLGQGLRHHRPLRGRQGHADPHAARARARARAVGLGDDAPPRPGEDGRRRLPLPLRRRVRAARRRPASSSSTPRYSGRRYGTLRSELEQRLARRRVPSCSRSRSRARARSAGRCPRRCRSSSRRRARRRCARGSSAAARTPPRRCGGAPARDRARGAARAGRVRARRVNDRLEDASAALEECVRAPGAVTKTS